VFATPDSLIRLLRAGHRTHGLRTPALGASRLIRFAAARGIQLRRPVVDRLVTAARDALPSADAAVARPGAGR
jgi:hypothetical protein